jgi:hypothetical protein
LEGAETFKISKQNGKGVLLQLLGNDIELTADKQQTGSPEDLASLEELLCSYADGFREPTDLPPHRTHDHSIPLQEGVQPVCVRPYRYPFYQNGEIEKIVKELLASGVIRQSIFCTSFVGPQGRWDLENVHGLPLTQQSHYKR